MQLEKNPSGASSEALVQERYVPSVRMKLALSPASGSWVALGQRVQISLRMAGMVVRNKSREKRIAARSG